MELKDKIICILRNPIQSVFMFIDSVIELIRLARYISFDKPKIIGR